MKILICTIIRNAELTIPRWWKKLTQITKIYPQIEFSLSVYENDSADNSKNMLNDLVKNNCRNYFSETFLNMEDIQTTFYQSVAHGDRVVNLANARNHCFEQVTDLSNYDYAMSVEVDSDFVVTGLKPLFDNVKNWDILSGCSYVSEEMNDSSEQALEYSRFYDHWATRLTENEDMWNCVINPNQPLFKSPLSDLHPKKLCSKIDGIVEVYSTFNLVCLYRMKPIIEGHRFGGYSERLKSFDCDTTVICENFHKGGYSRIGMLPYVEIYNDTFLLRQPLQSDPNCCG